MKIQWADAGAKKCVGIFLSAFRKNYDAPRIDPLNPAVNAWHGACE
jgi:hypothetical protein